MKFRANTIFITGGGSGIGCGLADVFHRFGNKVIMSGRRRVNLNAVTAADPGIRTSVMTPSTNILICL